MFDFKKIYIYFLFNLICIPTVNIYISFIFFYYSPATDGGTSDARFIKDYCEVVELGIRNQTLHQVDEFVFIEDIKMLQKVYLKLLENYFNKI